MSQNTPQSASQKRILTWLNDAYAMETEGAKTLERHANAAENYPQIQSKLQRHAEETRQHAEKVKGCAQRLGGQPSAAREALGTVMGTARGVATRAAKDTVVKNVLADYASEHFEIACYKSLIAAAEREGDQETARVCREILREEETMVGFLDEQIGDVTEQFLSKQASEEQSSSGSSSQDMQETGQKLLKGAQQNALPIVGGLVVAGAGAGLLLTRVLGGKQQSSEDQDADRDVYGSSGYQEESSPYSAVQGGAYSGEAAGYAQPLEQPYDQPSVTPTQLELDVDSGLQGDLQSDGLQSDGLQSGDLQSVGLQSGDLQSGSLQDDLQNSAQRDSFENDVVGVQSVTDQSPARSGDASPAVVEVAETEESPTGDPVADEVMTRLKEHRQVDDSDIEVTVEKNGRVTLKGVVDSKDIKQRAEKAVAGVLSVSQVRNQLKVKSQKA